MCIYMKIFELNNSKNLILSLKDISELLSITRESAKVSASRYSKNGLLIRLKKDYYITKNRFEHLKENEIYYCANSIQTPSYISLTTALSHYNISTQQQRNYIESISLKRSKAATIHNIDFTFKKIKKELYCDFELIDNYFIATPEKALFDAVYLTSIKRYNCDFDCLDMEKININIIEGYIEKENDLTKKLWQELCRRYKI
jgi:predicted transcriptional regulator of viral defense system